MPLQLLLNAPIREPNVMLNLVLDGQVAAATDESIAGDVYWRWEDDPTMEPQYLGSGAAGHDLIVPFDLKGKEIRLFLISKTSAGRGSVSDILASEQVVFTPTLLRDASFITLIAGETLAQNDLVNIYDDAGTAKCRKADADSSPLKPCDGWAVDAVTSGNNAAVCLTATLITGLSGLTIGADYYLSATAGAMTATAPSTSGNLRQRIGRAVSASVLSFERGEALEIA